MLQQTLEEALEYARAFLPQGRVATYIPELSKADPDKLGACIALPDGTQCLAGDWDSRFTMQSISKVVSLLLALETSGYDQVFSKVGMEPTGDAFNSIVKLETNTPKPLNPMINAGAIVVASCIRGDAPFARMLDLTRRLCGSQRPALNQTVYDSERQQGARNRAMAYFLQSEGLLGDAVEPYLDLYFRMCSVEVNAAELSRLGLVLACDGADPHTGAQLVPGWQAQVVKALMFTCGMYDGSGEFAVKVGIPSKSGVGGGIVSAVQSRMGLGVFSPGLDAKGNSIGSCKVLEYLSHKLALHVFSAQSQPDAGGRIS